MRVLTEVAFEVALDDGQRLAGTFVAPRTQPPHPAVLLLNGSGPIDRDSNQPAQVLNIANALARALAERGIASARFDKRGVRESTGDYLSTGFDRETADAAAALAALGSHPEIDASRLVVVGHSVGATVAMRLAADGGVAGIVLLAGAAGRGDEVLRRQTERIAESMTGIARIGRRRFLSGQAEAFAELPATTDDVVELRKQKLPARWFREFLAYDPAVDLARITCPVLAITGEKDLQVEAADVARIGGLVRGPFTGSTPPTLTHLLRHEQGPATIAGYGKQLRDPIAPDVVAEVVDWVASLTGAGASAGPSGG